MSNVTPSVTPGQQQNGNQLEPAYLTALRQAFSSAIASPLFTSDEKVVRRAIMALAIPDPEARFRKQFKDVAIRNLLANAPVVNGQVAYPATDAIEAEVQRLLEELKAKKARTA